MSFSAHADAKGIMQLVGQAEPESVLLVHGEAKKMEFLKQKIEQEFRRQPGQGGAGLASAWARQGPPTGSLWQDWPALLTLSLPFGQGSVATCRPTVRR